MKYAGCRVRGENITDRSYSAAKWLVQLARTWSSLVVSLFCFFFALDPPQFLFYIPLALFLSSTPYYSLSLDDESACAFLVLWCLTPREGANLTNAGRTQDGDGRQGSKVPGGLVGRTWLCYTAAINNTSNCCGYLGGALCFGCLSFSLGFLRYSVYTCSCWWCFLF